MGNGDAGASDGNRGRMSSTGGKGNVRLAAARNSLSYRIDVCRVVRAGKQGRQREVDVAALIGIVKVAAIGRGKPLRVSTTQIGAGNRRGRMLLFSRAVEDPLKIQRIWLGRVYAR